MRTTAFNNRIIAWDSDNVSGLQRRVSTLLGLEGFRTRSLTAPFAEAGLDLLSEERFAEMYGQDSVGEVVDARVDIRRRYLEAPLTGTAGREADRLFEDIVYLKRKAVSGLVLRRGIHLDRYRVSRPMTGDPIQAIFNPHDGEEWRVIGSYDSEDAAAASINALRRFLIRLNAASEGLHIVEHILLRPLGRDAHQEIEAPEGFYSFSLSVVFPGWTARFHTPEFRKLAEETVQLNCPAHIVPEIHWLDFDEMQSFEGLYRGWLDASRDDNGSRDEIGSMEERNAASRKLIEFLLESAVRQEAKLAAQS